MSVRSSTLQRAVDYLRPNAGTDKPVQSAERTAIEGLFRWAHESDEDVFDDEEVSRKGIRVETLSVEDEESEESARPSPEFFRPMSTNELLTYHMSDEDEATQLFAGSLPSMMEDLADMDDYGAADFFCVHLAWEFGVGIRSNIPKTEHGFGRSMEKISSWDFREYVFTRGYIQRGNADSCYLKCDRGFLKSIFRPRYLDALFFENDPSFAPVASWTTKDQAKQPHIMLTMRNETVGDDRLLRGELMALTAAICSRMAFHHFKQNAVIPVSPCILKHYPFFYTFTKHFDMLVMGR